MRFGGAVTEPWNTPKEWAARCVEMGYRAVVFPVNHTESTKKIDEFVCVAKENDLHIAEVGIWNNPIHPDPVIRAENVAYAVKQLELADYVKANCCVNVSGSRGLERNTAHPDNLTPETFDLIVASVQEIIDTAKPNHSFYTLEPMGWLFPHNADQCLAFIKAIDRKQFGAHFDLVNVVNSIEKFYNTTDLINEWFDKVAPYAKSCHIKDIALDTKLTLHLDECRLGTGGFDYKTLLTRAKEMGEDFPMLMEHSPLTEDYTVGMHFLAETMATL